MNKNLITYIAIATIAVIPGVSFAVDATPTPSASSAPTTGVSSVSGAPQTGSSVSTAAPSTGSSVSTASPSTGISGSTAAPSTGGSTSTAGNSGSTPITPPSTPASTGGTVNSSGGSSHRRNSINYGSCTLINTYMKLGAANNASEVAKLQAFLKNTEKLDVDVTGIFDVKTDAAVRAFQNKYMTTVMGPWGVNQASGYVYITTSKMINQIACNQPLTLNASELAIINLFRNASTETGSTETPASIDANNNQTESTEVGITDDNAVNTAAVANTSILRRFWNFILYLFR